MMLAEISTGELVSNGVALGLFVVALVALFKKNDVKVEQPITVKVIEALHDKSVTPSVQRLVRELTPGAEVVSLPTGHAPQYSAPDLLARAILPYLTRGRS